VLAPHWRRAGWWCFSALALSVAQIVASSVVFSTSPTARIVGRTFADVRAALAWASVPAIWGGLLLAPQLAIFWSYRDPDRDLGICHIPQMPGRSPSFLCLARTRRTMPKLSADRPANRVSGGAHPACSPPLAGGITSTDSCFQHTSATGT
jgi:hypothetical protein